MVVFTIITAVLRDAFVVDGETITIILLFITAMDIVLDIIFGNKALVSPPQINGLMIGM
jgi:hypothetical protein